MWEGQTSGSDMEGMLTSPGSPLWGSCSQDNKLPKPAESWLEGTGWKLYVKNHQLPLQ